MGDIQHANAKRTPRINKKIQESNETVELGARLSLNPKTIMKWKNSGRITGILQNSLDNSKK